jgi:asparagine synthase (glutamine-hydrolysing)
MCGIVGIADQRGVNPEAVDRMLDRIAYRGPDDRGLWISRDRRVALGHLRLAIIDLSPSGHQPMLDAAGDAVLTFNGEIYNFQEIRSQLEREGFAFRTRSDSEVILAAYRRWGVDAIRRLNGMFAFAIYDNANRRVVLVRDRIGKKPLYFHHAAARLTFASEVKAIVSTANRDWPFDPESVQAYFAFGYIPGERSIFRDIHRVLPGHVLTYDLERDVITSEAYWSIEKVISGRSVEDDSKHLQDELEVLLDDSVRHRLIADVPIGLLLSGGVDSSLATALAARHTQKLQTFTVTFPGGGTFDERQHARIVADHFGTDHHELPLPRADFETLRVIANHLDEPLGDPSIVPTYLISRLTRKHVTVALGGDGGDELFGGYPWYRRSLNAERNLERLPAALRKAAAHVAGWMPPGVRGRNLVRAHAGDLREFVITCSTLFDAGQRRSLLRPMLARLGDQSLNFPEAFKRSLWPGVDDSVTNMSVLDLRSFLPDDILIKVDRASMAFALEMRAPFLDYRVVEFALQKVPSNLKVTVDASRRLQRELARKLLPPQLEMNRKQGFVMPIHEWFSGDWGDEVAELVRNDEVQEWLDPNIADDLLRGQRKGRTNGLRLFSIAMFALWLQGIRHHEPLAVRSNVRELTSSHAG